MIKTHELHQPQDAVVAPSEDETVAHQTSAVRRGCWRRYLERLRRKCYSGRLMMHPWLIRVLFVACVAEAALACNGSDGADGVPGVQGPPGDQGPRGDAGPEGPAGEQGEDGPTGPAGEQGEDGPAGPTGDTGEPGRGATITGGGVNLELMNPEILGGVATVEFTIVDDEGRELDIDGVYSEGTAKPSFILSRLEENATGDSTAYTAYTLREKEGANGVTEVQSSTDTGGMFEELEPGRYLYTFGTEVDPSDAQAMLTHTVGAYVSRTFEGVKYVSNKTLSFVPSGEGDVNVLDVVTTNACNSCHTRLEFHGGNRRGVDMCVLCHTPENSINPETGNTIDFQVMIHKIHRGRDLPSVVGGDPYGFVGHGGAVIDYSDVGFPGQVQRCVACHQGTQGDRWKEPDRISSLPCLSCHDRTWVGPLPAPPGYTAHGGNPKSDEECMTCHKENGLPDSSVWVTNAHLTTDMDPRVPVVDVVAVDVRNVGPGLLPQVTFTVNVDGEAHDIFAERLARLRMTIAGPSTDYALSYREDGLEVAAQCSGTPVAGCIQKNGEFYTYFARTPLPAVATGTYGVAFESRLDREVFIFGSTTMTEIVGGIGKNPVYFFAVTDPEPVPRREVVSDATCNGCHQDLSFHGGGRRSVEYCVMCHNANLVGGATPPTQPGQVVEAESVHFAPLIHRIHSSPDITFPTGVSRCEACHLPETNGSPTFAERLPTLSRRLTCEISNPDPDAGITQCDIQHVEDVFTLPETSTCTSCHQSPAALAHAQTNSTEGAEACAVCHGAGRPQDVALMHALVP